MKKITSVAELKESILLLEIEQASQKLLLKEQFKITFESLKPVNLIKNALSDLAQLPDFKGDLMDTTMSLASGYLSKKIAVGESHNPLRKLLGTLLQIGVTNIVSKNANGIRSVVGSLLNGVFNKKNSSV